MNITNVMKNCDGLLFLCADSDPPRALRANSTKDTIIKDLRSRISILEAKEADANPTEGGDMAGLSLPELKQRFSLR